ncbi:hypothetical protein J6590_010805 [Homalodisca vitripennis]|nr:hypothetical protein J6590_010805 [Homalodisca vitripennis]
MTGVFESPSTLRALQCCQFYAYGRLLRKHLETSAIWQLRLRHRSLFVQVTVGLAFSHNLKCSPRGNNVPRRLTFKQGGLNTPPPFRCDATLSQYPYHCSEFARLLYTLTGPLPQANLIPKRKLPGFVNLLN